MDEHHTREHLSFYVGQAIDRALGERRGIVRTAHSFVPMDEALGFVALDLGGRPYCAVRRRVRHAAPAAAIGTDLIGHMFESVAIHGRLNLHAKVHYGRERPPQGRGAVQGASGGALDAATRVDERLGGAVPSTKGALA